MTVIVAAAEGIELRFADIVEGIVDQEPVHTHALNLAHVQSHGIITEIIEATAVIIQEVHRLLRRGHMVTGDPKDRGVDLCPQSDILPAKNHRRRKRPNILYLIVNFISWEIECYLSIIYVTLCDIVYR